MAAGVMALRTQGCPLSLEPYAAIFLVQSPLWQFVPPLVSQAVVNISFDSGSVTVSPGPSCWVSLLYSQIRGTHPNLT